MGPFTAFRIHEIDKKVVARFDTISLTELSEGDVVIRVDTRYTPGDEVLVTGCGLSETRDGGYAQYARIMGDCVIQVPKGLTSADTMRIGTAGFTAALAIHRMEQNGQTPDAGPIVVTGATGGVGSTDDGFRVYGFIVPGAPIEYAGF